MSMSTSTDDVLCLLRKVIVFYVGSLFWLHRAPGIRALVELYRLSAMLGSGRASTRPHTACAPAAKSGTAQASRVDPVVHTSSISKILRPRIASVVVPGRQQNAP